MNYQQLKAGERVALELSDIERHPGGKSYFVFRFDDLANPVRVGMFRYQEGTPFTPGMKIACYIKSDEQGHKLITQDYAVVFRDNYEEGRTYDFVVKKDMTEASPAHYIVGDNNGFQLRLPASGIDHLYINQRVRCVVTKLTDSFVGLRLVDNDHETNYLEMFHLDELLSRALTDEASLQVARELCLRFAKPLAEGYCKKAATAYRSGHGEWLFLAISAIAEHLPELLGAEDETTATNFLATLKAVTLYLLEGSDFISHLNDKERGEKQQLLAETVQRIDCFAEARSYINAGKDLEFIDRLLSNIQQSGYLYEPKRKLSVQIYLFRLKPELMDEKMQAIFDIITARPLDMWTTEPFRSAFLTQLRFFINSLRPAIDGLADIDNEADRQKLNQMVTALGIWLLLANENDSETHAVGTAMLYRYLSLYNTTERDNFLELSYSALLGQAAQPAFSLDDCKQPLLLALKINTAAAQATADGGEDSALSYVGRTTQLELSPDHITISPAVPAAGKKLKNALPDRLNLWKGLQIRSTESLGNIDGVSLAEIQRRWLQIERSLQPQAARPVNVRHHTIRPILEAGDKVKFYVEAMANNSGTYLCRFVEPSLNEDYAATLSISHIVRFNPLSDLTFFRQPETGRTFVYTGTVANINERENGKPCVDLHMMPFVDDFVSEGLLPNEEVDCIVMSDNGNNYTCLDGYGLTLILEKNEDCPTDLTPGTMVCVRTLGLVGCQMHADYIGLSSPEVPVVTASDAFRDIMQHISEETIGASTDGDEAIKDLKQEDALLSERRVEELIRLIDRKTVLMEDYKLTFHYLYAIKLMAAMIDDEQLTAYLANRLKLLLLLDNFAINHEIDTNELDRLSGLSSRVASRDVLNLRIISSLDDQQANGMLWRYIDDNGDGTSDSGSSKGSNSETRSLSRLALAYNLLSDMGFGPLRQEIHRQIDKLLHFNSTRGIKTYGEEGETKEFKTSLVFPPENHMRPDLSRQTETILKVICSFLNNRGGVLYIGVNDFGVPTGLQNDLNYNKFAHGQDSYDVYLHTQVRLAMHDVAEQRIETHFEQANGKDVYVVTVKPAPQPVMLKGVIYVRRGSSSVPLHGADANAFIETRQQGDRADSAMPSDTTTPTDKPTEDEMTSQVPGTADAPQPPVNGEATKPKDTGEANDNGDEPEHSLLGKTQLCLTGKQRNNVLNSWENHYIDPVKYLTLLPDGRYEVSANKSWPDGKATEIAIHEDETSGWFVLVYENGCAVKVPLRELLRQDGSYHRYNDSPLVFASPAVEGDNLLLFLRDTSGTLYYRLEPLSRITEGQMNATGQPFVTIDSTAYYCDIVPKGMSAMYSKDFNVGRTRLGRSLRTVHGTDDEKVISVLKKGGLRY